MEPARRLPGPDQENQENVAAASLFQRVYFATKQNKIEHIYNKS